MVELLAFDKETMYLGWKLKKCRSIEGSGRSFCIGGVFCYSVWFGSMYECEEPLGSVFWFVQKLSIHYIVNVNDLHWLNYILTTGMKCTPSIC